MRRTLFASGVWGIAVSVLLTGAARAQLDPPVGPIVKTGKLLIEIEPRTAVNATNTPGDALNVFRITQPGSYYLTGNVTGAFGKNGIQISASGVTLDLNGFSVIGSGAGSEDGITSIGANLTDIVVRNGSVRDWGDNGIDLSVSNPTGGRVVEVIATDNLGFGIYVGRGFIVKDCVAFSNDGGGFATLTACVVSGCISRSNAGAGLILGDNCNVFDCTVFSCSGTGISAASNTIVRDCVVSFCGGAGIYANSNNQILNNQAEGNGFNGSEAGIRVVGADNRIEGNNCTDNFIGVALSGTSNFLVRNTCAENSSLNWQVAAGNVGIVISATVHLGFSGDSGGASPGSTNPNANYTY